MSGALREHRSSLLVAGLSSAFGVVLLSMIGAIDAAARADAVVGGSDTASVLLTIAASLFIGIALYVSAVVTANTVATIVAGRTRTIALLRLLGSSARRQRSAVTREGLSVGLVGAGLGALAGEGVHLLLVLVLRETGVLPPVDYPVVAPVALLPVLAVVLTTWAAFRAGSRRVLAVRPMQALGASVERSGEEVGRRPVRHGLAVALIALGTLLLGGGVAVGMVSSFGVVLGFFGGILSFTGIVLAADLVMPPLLRLVGRAMARTATGRLAAENAVRAPERSARATIGLVIGVALVTTFSVGLQSYVDMLARAQQGDPEYYAGIDETFAMTVAVFLVLIGFSALIAAVGMANALSLSVLQRSRELGLLRALGFSKGQLRRMILAESAQLTITASAFGVVLGIAYGWAGAQSLFGSIEGGGLVPPGIPWLLVLLVVLGTGALAALAAVAPTRRAVRATPIEALAAA